MKNDPCLRISKAALACLDEAFLLCIPEAGNTIEIVAAAKRMGLEDDLGSRYGQECAHAIADRLVQAGFIVKVPNSRPVRVRRQGRHESGLDLIS